MVQLMTLILAWAVGTITLSIIHRRFMGVVYLPGLFLGVAGSILGVSFTFFVLGVANDLGGNVIGAFAGCFAIYYGLKAVVWSMKNFGLAMSIFARFAKIYWLGTLVGLITFAICRITSFPLWPVLVITVLASQIHWFVQSKKEFMHAWRNPREIPAAFMVTLAFIRHGATPLPVITTTSPTPTVPTPRPPTRRPRGGRRP